MNKKNINIYFLLLLFYMYFPFTFKGIGTYQYILIYGISYIGILFNIQKLKKYISTEYIAGSIISYVIVIIASIVIPIFHGTNDFSYTRKLISILNFSAKSIFLIGIFIKIYKENATPNLYIKYYVIACSMLVCSTVLFILFPSLKNFWRNNIIFENEYQFNLSNQLNYVTRYSIIGFSGFRETFMCVISYILTMYLILSKSNVMNNISKYIVLIFSVIGTFFYGRIGFITVICLTLLLVPILLAKKPKILIKVICSIMILILTLSLLKEKNETIKAWYNWAFAIFINYQETGELYTGSSDALFNNMYFKIDKETFLIGDGLYRNIDGSNYKLTDAGLMRPILFYGIFFTIIEYMVCIFIIYGIYINYKKENDKFGKYISFLIFVSLLIFEIKGEIYYFLISLILQ